MEYFTVSDTTREKNITTLTISECTAIERELGDEFLTKPEQKSNLKFGLSKTLQHILSIGSLQDILSLGSLQDILSLGSLVLYTIHNWTN